MGMIRNGLCIRISNGLGNALSTFGHGRGNGLELEQASGVLSECKLIGHVCLKEIHAV
jgi:hypothetical protein